MKPGTYTHEGASLKVSVAKALPQAMRGKVYEITAVRTSPESRGQGHATHLLCQACNEADLAGKFLMVNVDPDPDSPLDRNALAKFYGSFGFKPIQIIPALLMVRPCIGKVNNGR